MEGIRVIFIKELTRVFKDKKLIFSLFILPVLLIVGMYTLIGTLMTNANRDIEEHIPVVYIQNAPEDFKLFLKEYENTENIIYLTTDDNIQNIKNGILQGTIDLFISFDNEFEKVITEYEDGSVIPQVKTFYNPSEEYSDSARSEYVSIILESYRQQLLANRISDLGSITIFTVDSDNEEMVIQDNEKATGKILGELLPYFITLMLFAGAMSLGVDTITGEKERGTMASMLITPVKRSSIVLGKVFALMVLSGLSAATYVISMVASAPIMMKSFGGDEVLESISIRFTVGQISQLALLLISLVFLYVALISLISVFAKTVKEGTTYISPIYFVVIAIGMITMFSSKDVKIYSYLIPLYNSTIALKDLFARELSTLEFLMTFVSTIAAGGMITGIIVKAFNSEKVMFNA